MIIDRALAMRLMHAVHDDDVLMTDLVLREAGDGHGGVRREVVVHLAGLAGVLVDALLPDDPLCQMVWFQRHIAGLTLMSEAQGEQ